VIVASMQSELDAVSRRQEASAQLAGAQMEQLLATSLPMLQEAGPSA